MKKRFTLLVAAAALALGACNGSPGASGLPSVPDLESLMPEVSPATSPEMSPEMSPDESLLPAPS
jgi:hypothetical protein